VFVYVNLSVCLCAHPRSGETVVFETTEEECHVVGSLLKSLLRELPEPLFTFALYERVIAAPDLEAIANLIASLPPVSKATLGFIIQFMRLVRCCEGARRVSECVCVVCVCAWILCLCAVCCVLCAVCVSHTFIARSTPTRRATK